MILWIPSGYKESSSYVPPSWSDGTDEEIVEALEKHYNDEIDLTEYWSIGDERTISLNSIQDSWSSDYAAHPAQDVIFVITEIGGKILADGVTECAFQVDQKNCLNKGGYMLASNNSQYNWNTSVRRTWCNGSYRNAFPSTIKPIFKQFINQSGYGQGTSNEVIDTTDYFALRAVIEMTGESNYTIPSGEGSQVTWYQTALNRIKAMGNSSTPYWTRTAINSNYYIFGNILVDGNVNFGGTNGRIGSGSALGIAPFGVI